LPVTAHPLTHDGLLAMPSQFVRIPSYDIRAASTEHAHIGPGVFHRGHQAVYADDLLSAGRSTSAICAISMRSSTLRDAIGPQDFLYSTIGLEERVRVIGSIREVIVATEDPRKAVARLASPDIRVVTMSVTEMGYHWSHASQSLDVSAPEIAHDIEDPAAPASMPGLLVASLGQRLAAGIEPFTVVPCDNLPGNGDLTRSVLRTLAECRDPSLAAWIDDDVPICSTMVDRMVPTTTETDRLEVERIAGIRDRWPIRTEPYGEWIIENNQGGFLPPWVDVGAQVVGDIAPYEELKLHILNASHTALAYLGLRTGHVLISDALRDPAVARHVAGIMDSEIAPATEGPSGVSVAAYSRTTLERFTNDSLGYTTAKVGSDGAQKIQQRVLPIVERLLSQGSPIDGLALVITVWLWCMFGPQAGTLGLSDPWLEHAIGPRIDLPMDPSALADQMLSNTSLFGDLSRSPVFASAVLRNVEPVWSSNPLGPKP
jgi:fructuronate reductase